MSSTRHIWLKRVVIISLAIAVIAAGAWLVNRTIIIINTDQAIQDALFGLATRHYNSEAYSEYLADDSGRYAAAHKTLWVERKRSTLYVYALTEYGIYDKESGRGRAGGGQPMIFIFSINADGRYFFSSYKASEVGLPEGWPQWLEYSAYHSNYSGLFQKQVNAYLK